MRFWIVFFVFVSHKIYAQQWLGISSSNYSGTYSVYQNPANIVDSRFKVFVNLAGGNAEIINNYAGWAAPYSVIGLATNTVRSKYKSTSGLVIYKNDYIDQSYDKKNTTAFIAADLRGPSFLVNFDKLKVAIGLSTRLRLLTNLTDLSPDIGRVLSEGTNIPDFFGVEKKDNHFNFNVNGYAELGASFGVVLKESDQDFMKFGFTVKRLNGLINTHLQANDLDFTLTTHPTRPKRQLVNISEASGDFGILSNKALSNFGFNYGWLLGNLSPGIGYGADIGFVYEFRPDYDKYDMKLRGKMTIDGTKNKYKYKLGFSLIDIGQINFKQLEYAKIASINRSNTIIQPGTFTKIENSDDLYYIMNLAFSVPESDYKNSFSIPLPMALSINFDYKISEKIYLNAFLLQNLSKFNDKAMIQPSVFAITPRYETRLIDVSIPIALQNGYKNLTVGIAGRIGGFFIGSDNLGGFLNIGSPRGISAYMGLSIPIFRKLPKNPNECYSEIRPRLLDKIRRNKKKWK